MVYQQLMIKIRNNSIKINNNLKTSSFYKNKDTIHIYIILGLNFYVLYYTRVSQTTGLLEHPLKLRTVMIHQTKIIRVS